MVVSEESERYLHGPRRPVQRVASMFQVLGRSYRMPYMSCPNCRLTHYETATAVVTKRSCPRCQRKLGIESILFESPTLTDARATLAQLGVADPTTRRFLPGTGGGAAPVG
jgi:hypothetical protein